MTREQTVQMYAPAFLEGRSEEARQKFWAKSLDKQYQSVMSFRRRQNLQNAETKTAAVLLKLVRDARRQLESLDNLSEREAEKLRNEIEGFKEDINNFERLKANAEAKRLLRDRDHIEARLREINEKYNF